MGTLTQIIIFIMLSLVFIYLSSYGVFVWKQKNKLGSIAVFLLGIITLLLPILTIILAQ